MGSIIIWTLAQLACFILAYISAKEETPIVLAFRKHVPPVNPYKRPFHVWGWCLIAFVSLPWIAAQWVWGSPWQMLAMIPVSIAIYWWRFEGWLNRWTHKAKHYVGEDAATDRWLTRVFGANAGRNKNRTCVAVIITINIIFTIIQAT